MAPDKYGPELMISRSPYKIPPVANGLKIGLFGGSFNPPHMGHVQVSKMALKSLGLDQLWWIITPGNPLKKHHGLAPLEERIAYCNKMINHPDIRVCAFEENLRSRYTADTIEVLRMRRATAKFVWVMGADNLTQFHKWDRWQSIAKKVPLAIIDRPGSTVSPNSTPATQSLSKYRVDEVDARLLPNTPPPAWVFIHGPRSFLSSSQIREQS